MKVNILPDIPANLTLLCDVKLDPNALPEFVEVTQDVNGHPFSFNKVIIDTDIVGSASYIPINFNNSTIIHDLVTKNYQPNIHEVIIAVTSPEYAYINLNGFSNSSIYLKGETGPRFGDFIPQKEIHSIKFPSAGATIKKGTFLKIWGFN